MDREEMRFLAVMEFWKRGVESSESVASANRLMEAFDKGSPDYVDPAKLEETIQARVDQAVESERESLRSLLTVAFHRGIDLGMCGGGEVIQSPHRLGQILRFSEDTAKMLAEEVVPLVKAPVRMVPRG